MNAELSVQLRTRMDGTNNSRELYQVVEGLQVQPELQAGVGCQHAWRQGVCQVDCLSNVPCPSHQCASVSCALPCDAYAALYVLQNADAAAEQMLIGPENTLHVSYVLGSRMACSACCHAALQEDWISAKSEEA